MKQKTPLNTQVFSSFADAESFRHHWDRLASDNPFIGWDWLSNWWNAFGKNSLFETNQLAIVAMTDSSGSLRGIAPFYVRSKISGRSLRFLGDGRATSDYTRVITEENANEEVAQTLADLICSEEFASRFGSLNLIELEGVKAGQVEIEMLQRNLSVKGWRLHQEPIESAWSMPLGPDWTTQLGRMCTSQKRKAKKITKQFESGIIIGETIENLDELDGAWSDFVRLHQKRRIELGEPGCFHDPDFEQFLLSSTRELMVKRQARLVFAKYEGERIAASLVFNNDETIFLYQSGIDSSFDHLDPGHLSNYFMILWGSQQGYRFLDFLRGDEHYKKRWGAAPSSLLRTRLISPKWSTRVRESIWQTARGFKKRSQSLLKRLRKGDPAENRSRQSESELANVSDRNHSQP